MATRWYNKEDTLWRREDKAEKNKTEEEKRVEEAILKSEYKAVATMNNIMENSFSNLVAFDSPGYTVGIYGGNGEHTGITLSHAIICEDNEEMSPSNFGTFNEIRIGDIYIALLLTSNNTIEEMKTNLPIGNTIPLEEKIEQTYEWFDWASKGVYNTFNNQEYYRFGDLNHLKYYGPRETECVAEISRELRYR